MMSRLLENVYNNQLVYEMCLALPLVLHNYPESVVLESSVKPSQGKQFL